MQIIRSRLPGCGHTRQPRIFELFPGVGKLWSAAEDGFDVADQKRGLDRCLVVSVASNRSVRRYLMRPGQGKTEGYASVLNM